MKKNFEILSIILLDVTAIVLIALQIKSWGWILFALGLMSLLGAGKQFRKDIFLIYISLFLLGITPISTSISLSNFLYMGTTLGLAILLPYLVSKYVYKDNLVKFKFHHGRRWYKKEIFYIFFTAAVSYLLLPFMLLNTGSYLNWEVQTAASFLFVLFLGTNALGIWDELFFISTVFGILRRYLPFATANLVQSIIFTSFLFELGFRGWSFIPVFIFALLQGVVFRKSESLFYVITIHLTLDLILYLVLIHLHHPELLDFFVSV